MSGGAPIEHEQAGALPLRGRPALVTGAGGFIGSHVVEALVRAGARVRALVHYRSDGGAGQLDTLSTDVRESIEIVAGDVRDAELMVRFTEGQELVLHLAALIGIPYSYAAPRSYVETNVTGTLNMLEAARRFDVARVIHTSTSECYGSAQRVPMDEQHPLNAQSPYAASKVAGDMLASSYARSFDMPVVTLRPFNTYGPRQSARAVIPSLVAQALQGGAVQMGAQDPVRDFVFVEDTARAFLAACDASDVVGHTIHLGSGVGVRMGDLAEQILDRVSGRCGGARGRVEHDARRLRPEASEVDRLVCDPAQAARLLGWKTEIDLATGLDRCIDHRLANPLRDGPGRYAT